MKKLLFFMLLLSGSFFSLYAQIAINDNGAEPNASSILDISATDKGVLLPRVDIANLSTEAPLTAPVAEGMLVYNTNTTTGEGFYIWRGSEWTRLTTTSDVHLGASKMVFRAEYPGATLMADGSDNSGFMISDNGGASASWMNFYEWWSGEVSLQDYDVVLRITLPDDFKSWQTNAIVIDYQTTNASTAQSYFSAGVYLESSGTALGSIAATASTTWATATVPSTSLSSLAAGETIAVVLKLGSSNDQATRVGDVNLNYNK